MAVYLADEQSVDVDTDDLLSLARHVLEARRVPDEVDEDMDAQVVDRARRRLVREAGDVDKVVGGGGDRPSGGTRDRDGLIEPTALSERGEDPQVVRKEQSPG